MIKLFLFFIVSNPFYSEQIPGEWLGSDIESPATPGNVSLNPATSHDFEYLSLSSFLSRDDYGQNKVKISNITITFPTPWNIMVGGTVDLLYDASLSGDTSIDNQWEDYRQKLERMGGLSGYGVYLAGKIDDFSLGVDANILNGEVEDRWSIIFDRYDNIYDTLSTGLRGYYAGAGFSYKYKSIRIGGYFCFYQKVEYWQEDEEKISLSIDKPVRFGIDYNIRNETDISLSINRKSTVLMGNLKFLNLGYGRIYGSGYDYEVNGDRFIGGISWSLFKRVPILTTVEYRRYSGDLDGNEFIGRITVGFPPEKGGNK